MYDLTKITLKDVTELGMRLRHLGSEAGSIEEIAHQTVDYIYECFVSEETGEKSCALVRFYKTFPYYALKPELRDFADNILGDGLKDPMMKCLTLLATVGQQPEWNSPEDSAGHKAIPLPSEEVVRQLPMIAQLVNQFGLEISTFLKPASEILLEATQETFNVFYVSEALDSPFVPAQAEFVIPYGIRSALGFGGMLPTGDLFAVIIFSKAPISRTAADWFKVLGLNTTVAVLSLAEEAVFN